MPRMSGNWQARHNYGLVDASFGREEKVFTALHGIQTRSSDENYLMRSLTLS